jgi:hypothetical protein
MTRIEAVLSNQKFLAAPHHAKNHPASIIFFYQAFASAHHDEVCYIVFAAWLIIPLSDLILSSV